jgi:hypothetical protein
MRLMVTQKCGAASPAFLNLTLGRKGHVTVVAKVALVGIAPPANRYPPKAEACVNAKVIEKWADILHLVGAVKPNPETEPNKALHAKPYASCGLAGSVIFHRGSERSGSVSFDVRHKAKTYVRLYQVAA